MSTSGEQSFSLSMKREKEKRNLFVGLTLPTEIPLLNSLYSTEELNLNWARLP